jgi:hypothetical protein
MSKREVWAMLKNVEPKKHEKNRHNSVRILKQWVLRCPPKKRKKERK